MDRPPIYTTPTLTSFLDIHKEYYKLLARGISYHSSLDDRGTSLIKRFESELITTIETLHSLGAGVPEICASMEVAFQSFGNAHSNSPSTSIMNSLKPSLEVAIAHYTSYKTSLEKVNPIFEKDFLEKRLAASTNTESSPVMKI